MVTPHHSPTSSRRTGWRTAVAVLMLSVAACGEGATPDGPATVAPFPTVDESATTTAAPQAAVWLDDDAAGTITVAETSIGSVLTDGDGFVLYVHSLDEGGTPMCTERCLDHWEPVAAPVTADGDLTATLLGAVTNAEGLAQVTFNGQPLYRSRNDSPGDLTGHGTNDIWFAISPDGSPVHR